MSARPAPITPEIQIRRVANGYLVDVEPRGGWAGCEDRYGKSIGECFSGFYVFETFAALSAWLLDRFARAEDLDEGRREDSVTS